MRTTSLNKLSLSTAWSTCFGTRLSRYELEEAIVLLPSCIAGCARAQTRFYMIFYRPMIQFCLKYTKGNLDKTNDISQEAFAKIFQNLSMLNTPESLHVWVAKVFLSEIHDQYRNSRTLKQRPNMEVSQIDEEKLWIPSDVNFENEHDFDALLSACPQRQRTILRMVAKGFNYDDIGKELNLPIGTVKCLVSRERKKIRKTYHWVRA